jgi:hypothetical protein
MKRTITITGDGFVGTGQEHTIWQSDDGTRRRVFVPRIVNNAGDPTASVKGDLYYQRKTAAGHWVDCDAMPLTQVKADEAVKISMDSATTKELADLIATYKEAQRLHGVETGVHTYEIEVADFTPLRDALANDEQAAELLATEAGAEMAATVVRRLAEVDSPNKLAEQFGKLTPQALNNIGQAARIAEIQEALDFWENNKDNAKEEDWQSFFTERPWILAQALAQPVVLMKDKAYVGGKTYKNKEGQVTDYLYKNSLTNNTALVEIKTPVAKLVGGDYRKDTVASLGEELVGGLAQVLMQRNNFIADSHRQRSEAGDEVFHVLNPEAVLVVGKAEGLTGHALETFEVFRGSAEVEIVTFDELFAILRGLHEMLVNEPTDSSETVDDTEVLPETEPMSGES